jgi:hypothetical protein
VISQNRCRIVSDDVDSAARDAFRFPLFDAII